MIIKPFIMTMLIMHNSNSMDGDSHLYHDITSLAYTMTQTQCNSMLFDVAYAVLKQGNPPILLKCEKVESFFYGRK